MFFLKFCSFLGPKLAAGYIIQICDIVMQCDDVTMSQN